MQKIKIYKTSLSLRHTMIVKEIISEILAKNPQISQSQLLDALQVERDKTDGLLSDETILRLIATKYGVVVKQNSFQTNGVLSMSRLISGLYDVTVVGIVIANFPVKTFQGNEKSGKFAALILADNDGLSRVILWNEKAEMVEKGGLKVGQIVKLIHCYTRADRFGKTEIHLGTKSLIELQDNNKINDYPSIEKFTTKINALDKHSGVVNLAGTVKAILGKSTFTRSDGANGIVLRVTLRDDSGEVPLVFWNEKVEEIEKKLRDTSKLLLVNAKIKETKNGTIEVHVDSNTYVDTNNIII